MKPFNRTLKNRSSKSVLCTSSFYIKTPVSKKAPSTRIRFYLKTTIFSLGSPKTSRHMLGCRNLFVSHTYMYPLLCGNRSSLDCSKCYPDTICSSCPSLTQEPVQQSTKSLVDQQTVFTRVSMFTKGSS